MKILVSNDPKPYAEKIIDVYNNADEWEAEILRLGLLVETQDHSKLYISAKKGEGIVATRQVEVDSDILGTIFGTFCIGK